MAQFTLAKVHLSSLWKLRLEIFACPGRPSAGRRDPQRCFNGFWGDYTLRGAPRFPSFGPRWKLI